VGKARRNVGRAFVQEFVLGLGFLSGLWIYVGVDPKAEIFKIFYNIIQSISPNPLYSFLFWFIPALLTVIAVVGAYRTGGVLGIAAVVLAFFAGLLINTPTAIILLLAAIIAGFAAPFLTRISRRR
jgi:hypothetical protein